MKKQVLIVTCEMLPLPGFPVRGGGLRVWGLGEGLKSVGHDVRYSMPKDAVPAGAQLGEEYTALLHEPETINDLVLQVMPDVLIVEQWGLASFLEDLKIPLVLDLHGPLSLENAFKEGSNFLSDALTKIDTLAKADLLLCPGEYQRQYFLTWFLLAGASPIEAPIEVVPVALGRKSPKHQWPAEPHIVFGGVTWPWIDPFPGLEILAERVAGHATAQLDLYVGSPPISYSHPLYAINKNIFLDYRERLGAFQRVTFRDFIPRDELLAIYGRSSLAYDLYQPNSERQLAFTTRTIEYLWCGLPVIYGDYGELAAPIRDYDAGWVVNPKDRSALEQVIDEALNQPDVVQRKGANAQRLASDRFTWDKAILPLARFVENPKIRVKQGSLLTGFRDYFRKESVSQILDAKNEIAELNGELRRAATLTETDRRERDKKIEELSDRVKKLINENDENLRRQADQHHEETLRKDDDLRRLQEKLDHEVQIRDEELSRLRLDRQTAEQRAQDEVRRLTREKEELRDASAAEMKTLTEKKDAEFKELRLDKEKERNRLQQRIDKLTESQAVEKKSADEEIKRLNLDQEEARKQHEQEIKKLIERQEAERKELQTEREAERDKLQQRIDVLVEQSAQIKKDADEEIKRLNLDKEEARKEHEREIKNLIERQDAERKELALGRETERDKLQQRIDALVEQTAQEKKAADEEIKRLNLDREEARKLHEQEVRRIVERHETDRLALRAELESERDKLQRRIDTLIEQAAQEQKAAADESRRLNLEKEETRKLHEQETKKLVERYDLETARLKLELDDAAKESQRKLVRESERREDLEKELNGEVRRLNLRIEQLIETHAQTVDQIRIKHEESLQLVQQRADQQLARRDDAISSMAAKLDLIREESEKKIKDLEAANLQLKDSSQLTIEQLQKELTMLKSELDSISSSVEERDKKLEQAALELGLAQEKAAALETELRIKLDDLQKLVAEKDRLQADIAGKLIELEREVQFKELFVEESERRFAALEDRLAKERQEADTLQAILDQARLDLDRTNRALADHVGDAERLRGDLEKTRAFARDLEGEVTGLRRRQALQERLLAGFETDDALKAKRRIAKRWQRAVVQFPRLAYLFTVNLATNLYVSLWQNRTGKKIFPGT